MKLKMIFQLDTENTFICTTLKEGNLKFKNHWNYFIILTSWIFIMKANQSQ